MMMLSILAIGGFQAFWLKQTYVREKHTLDLNTDIALRDAVTMLQVSKLKLDRLPSGGKTKRIRIISRGSKVEGEVRMGMQEKEGMVSAINVMRHKVSDSSRPGNAIAFLAGMDSLQEPITLPEVKKKVSAALLKQNIDIPFDIQQRKAKDILDEPPMNGVTVGLANPVTYTLETGSTASYLLKRIAWPLLFSVFLLALTVISFILLYRNMLRQKRLSEMKNELIGNITHELKTPVATVSVAVEALKDFNVMSDPARTKEYLGIAGGQLNRLSTLIDKVLRTSMFESGGVVLKPERFNIRDLAAEVTASMHLQTEQTGANINVSSSGEDFTLVADKLHIAGVLHNLLDNALKYQRDNAVININIDATRDDLMITVRDNGPGIPREYLDKIFDRFFRVPKGNLHDVKGYGLGLTYVAHIIDLHHGKIKADSDGGSYTTFIIKLPRNYVR